MLPSGIPTPPSFITKVYPTSSISRVCLDSRHYIHCTCQIGVQIGYYYHLTRGGMKKSHQTRLHVSHGKGSVKCLSPISCMKGVYVCVEGSATSCPLAPARHPHQLDYMMWNCHTSSVFCPLVNDLMTFHHCADEVRRLGLRESKLWSVSKLLLDRKSQLSHLHKLYTFDYIVCFVLHNEKLTTSLVA